VVDIEVRGDRDREFASRSFEPGGPAESTLCQNAGVRYPVVTARTRAARWAGPTPVRLLLLAGATFTLLLNATLTDEVFFAGDGGLKALMVRQFAAGNWHADLRLSAEPWVEALWAGGLYPFAPPFVYPIGGRHYIHYPLSFPALTAPFYAALGFRALHLWPLLGAWATWAAFLLACRRRRIGHASTAFGLAGLVFASSLTPYAAMFWEHTLAVALSFGGFALALPSPRGEANRRDLLGGGLLLGLSVWLRPESAVFAGAAAAALLRLGARWRQLFILAAAGAVPALAYLASNQWMYGSPLSLQALQSWEPGVQRDPDMSPLQIARRLGVSLLVFHPVLLALALLALLWPRPTRAESAAARGDRAESAAWLAGAIFCAVSALLLPNPGGKQFGPRYWMHALPLLWWAAALRFEVLRTGRERTTHRATAVGLVALLAAGVWLNAVRGARALLIDYRERTLPALRLVRETQPDVVVVGDQHVAQELEAAFDVAPFVRVRTGRDLRRLCRAMARAGRGQLLLLDVMPRQIPEYRFGDHLLRFGPPAPAGSYFASRGSLVPRPRVEERHPPK
jgi:hypothetical protein